MLMKLDIDELKKVPSHLSGFKSKVDKADVDKLVTVPFNLKNFKCCRFCSKDCILRIG